MLLLAVVGVSFCLEAIRFCDYSRLYSSDVRRAREAA